MNSLKTILLFALILVSTSVALSDGLPPLTLPAGAGVNIHFISGHEQDLKMIADAGFKFVRMDFFWQDTERQKGKYDWSAYDDFTTELAQYGLRPYYVLDYSNPLYEPGVVYTNPVTHKVESALASPQHPESIAAYARWAAAAAKHFRGRGIVWEIWNEPNISFWKPKADVHQYIAMALATAKAIRAANPEACLVGPTTSGFGWNFLEAVFKSGLLNYLSGVSVHPYRSKAPETAAADYARLRALIDHYAPSGKEIPIISGEWGYATVTNRVSPKTQADYIVRQQLSNLLCGVPLSIWYDWKNDGKDPGYSEDNFGTVSYDLQPKPAYLAIQNLTREQSGYRIARRYDTGNTNDFVLVLTNANGETKLAAWTMKKPDIVQYSSHLKLQLSPTPQYVAVH